MIHKSGTFYAILAYLLWGLLPIYWKMLKHVDAKEILVHRAIWTFVLCLLFHRQLKGLIKKLKNKRNLFILISCGLIIGGNWLIYTWAVVNNRLIECSLGYYINPLLSVFLGVVFLKEKINPPKTIAIVLATIAVGYLTYQFGSLPWISLSLALTFGIYGLIRKLLPLHAMDGLTVETATMFFPALFYFYYLESNSVGHFFNNSSTTFLLMLSGIATAAPLIAFAAAAKRMPLVSLGFFQYIAPSCQLALGVLIYNEPFTKDKIIAFSLIWCALFIFTCDSFRQHQKN